MGSTMKFSCGLLVDAKGSRKVWVCTRISMGVVAVATWNRGRKLDLWCEIY